MSHRAPTVNRKPSVPRAGFTLLEILVVVLIITILATIVGVNVAREPGKAKAAAAKAQIVTLRTALQMYRMEQGGYPTQEQGLNALCEKPAARPVPERYPEGGYLETRALPLDPWKHGYVYLVPGPNGEPYEIVSYGADGQPGGTGEAADISSATFQE
jgi:general secretion pathway protein G